MNKDLNTIENHLARTIDLLVTLHKNMEERKVDSVEAEWYNKGRADAYGFAVLQLDDIRCHINSLKEINNDLSK